MIFLAIIMVDIRIINDFYHTEYLIAWVLQEYL